MNMNTLIDILITYTDNRTRPSRPGPRRQQLRTPGPDGPDGPDAGPPQRAALMIYNYE